MVLRRCAWHRHYFGYPLLCGITRRRGFGVSDGICRRCAARIRHELSAPAPADRSEPGRPARWDPLLVLPPAAAMMLVAAMILAVAPPLEQIPVIGPVERPAPVALGHSGGTPAPGAPRPAEPLAPRLAGPAPSPDMAAPAPRPDPKSGVGRRADRRLARAALSVQAP